MNRRKLETLKRTLERANKLLSREAALWEENRQGAKKRANELLLTAFSALGDFLPAGAPRLVYEAYYDQDEERALVVVADPEGKFWMGWAWDNKDEERYGFPDYAEDWPSLEEVVEALTMWDKKCIAERFPMMLDVFLKQIQESGKNAQEVLGDIEKAFSSLISTQPVA